MPSGMNSGWGLSSPLDASEQLSYLLFSKRPDDREGEIIPVGHGDRSLKVPLDFLMEMDDDNREVVMKLSHPFQTFHALSLLTLIFSGCSIVTPTPALPEAVVVLTLTAQPSPLPTGTPAFSAQLSCSLDSDCVLAYRTDQCCSCGSIYNRQAVEEDRRLRYVNAPDGYQYEKWRTPRAVCPMVMCAPCPMPPFGLVCDANVCREAQTWQEIWSACGSLEQNQKTWCHINAATMAFAAGEEDQAVKICNSLQGNDQGGASFAEDCILQVGRSLMANDPQASAKFCRAHLTILLGNCLNETAFAIGRADVESALALCNEINTQTDTDRNQKDYCFHNVAMSVAKVDLVQAQQICEMMSQGSEQCRADAENPQGVP